MSKKLKTLLTIREVAALKNVPIPTVKAYCQRGKFPHARLEESPIGKFWLIPLSDLDLVEFQKRGRPRNDDK